MCLTLLLVLFLAGCNTTNNEENADNDNTGDVTNETNNDNNEAGTDDNNTNDNTTSNGNNTNTVTVEDVSLNVDDALQIFYETFPDVQVSAIELDVENGELMYEIDGFDDTNKYSAHINEAGEVLHQEQEALDADDSPQELQIDSYVTIDEAITTAKQAQETGDLSVTSWNLDIKNGHAMFEIKFEETNRKEVEVTINAETGEQDHVEVDD